MTTYVVFKKLHTERWEASQWKDVLFRGGGGGLVYMWAKINLRSKVDFCILDNSHICWPHNNLLYKKILIIDHNHNNFQLIVMFFLPTLYFSNSEIL